MCLNNLYIYCVNTISRRISVPAAMRRKIGIYARVNITASRLLSLQSNPYFEVAYN